MAKKASIMAIWPDTTSSSPGRISVSGIAWLKAPPARFYADHGHIILAAAFAHNTRYSAIKSSHASSAAASS